MSSDQESDHGQEPGRPTASAARTCSSSSSASTRKATGKGNAQREAFWGVLARRAVSGAANLAVAVCILCEEAGVEAEQCSLKISDGSTTGICRHFVRKHSDQKDKIVQYMALTDQETALLEKQERKKLGLSHQLVTDKLMPWSPPGKYSKNNLYENLITLACRGNLPLNAITSPNFKNFVRFLHPQAAKEMPSAQTLAKHTPVLYEKLFDFVKSRVLKSSFKVTIIVDGWTSRNMIGFFAILVRFVELVDDTPKIREVLLDAVESSSHQGLHCADMIVATLEKFGIPLEQVAAVACDNASACGVMITSLNIKLQVKHRNAESPIVAAYCFAHSIHRVVLFMMTPINGMLEKIRNVVKKIHRSAKLCSEFEKELAKHEIDCGKKYKTRKTQPDVCTRWNSTYEMLEGVLLLQVPLKNVAAAQLQITLEDADFEIVQLLLPILRAIAKITKLLSQKDIATYSHVVYMYNKLWDCFDLHIGKISPDNFKAVLETCSELSSAARMRAKESRYWQKLERNEDSEDSSDENDKSDEESSEDDSRVQPAQAPLEEDVDSDPELGFREDTSTDQQRILPKLSLDELTPRERIGLMARLGVMLLRKHYNRVEDAAVLAMVLDPRINVKYCQHSRWKGMVENYVIPLVQKSFEKYSKALAPEKQVPGESADRARPAQELQRVGQKRKAKLALACISDSDADENAADFEPPARPNTEVDKYIERYRESLQSCPLTWWAANKTEFPILYKIAMDHFSISATSIAAEQLFSTMGLICTPRRNRLRPVTISRLICIKNWQEFGGK
jgi:hypothetical protein